MSGITRTTTKHSTIRRWATARGGVPARVEGTQRDKAGLLRIAFPNYGDAPELDEIAWEEFFEKFEAEGLALTYQEATAQGQISRFNRLVYREA